MTRPDSHTAWLRKLAGRTACGSAARVRRLERHRRTRGELIAAFALVLALVLGACSDANTPLSPRPSGADEADGIGIAQVEDCIPGTLVNGQTYLCSISAPGELQNWSFTAENGDFVVVSLAEAGPNTSFTPLLRVIAPSGTQLWGAFDGVMTQFASNVNETGTFQVIVSDAGSQTGDYRLTLARAPGDFVVPADDEGGPMINGATHLGVIEVGDVDMWSFSADDGDYVAVSLGKADPDDDLVPLLRVIAPSGRSLYGAFGMAVQFAQNVTESGTYYVIVGSAGPRSGDYRLTLARAPADFITSPGDEGGPLTNGANHTGTIEVGALDQWSFTADAGDYVALSLAEVEAGSPLWPWMRLISPSGALLAGPLSSSVVQVSITVPESGTYRVIIGSNSGQGGSPLIGTGDYQLTLAQVPGEFIVPEDDEGGPLTNGENHTGTIHLGDLDQWSFSASEGDYIALSIGEVQQGSSLWPWIRLISPSGRQLGSSLHSAVAQINVTAPESGTYRVIIGSNSGQGGSPLIGTGDYRLTLAQVPGAFRVPEDDEGGPLMNGVNHFGTIHLGDLDQWSFTATAGDFVTLSLAEVEVGSPLWPWMRLISPTGQVLAGPLSSTAVQISITVPVSGSYRVIVGSNSGQGGSPLVGTGEYRLQAIGIGGPENQPPVPTITSPTSGATFTEGDEITFTGSATDPEDGNLTGGALVWTSSRDGQIGTGTSFSRSDLSVGTHTITLTATDSEGLTGTASVTITIEEEDAPPPPPNQPPVANISSPADGAEFSEGEEITFQGSATDPEEGALTGNALVWTSSLDGPIGTGTSFSRSDLSVGTHVITLTATDSEGLTGTASVTITIQAVAPPPPPPPPTCEGADVVVPLNRVWSTGMADGTISLGSIELFTQTNDIEAYLPKPNARAEDVRRGATWKDGTLARRFDAADSRLDVRVTFRISDLVRDGNLSPATSSISVWGRDRDTGTMYCGIASVNVVP